MTHSATSLRALADEAFVSLTTFRRSGEGVATPVWVIADPDGDGLVVMTPHRVYDDRLEQAFKDAYGAEFRVIMGIEKLRGGSERVALHIGA